MSDNDSGFINKIPPAAFKRIKADVQPDVPFTIAPDHKRLVVAPPDPPQEASS